jgi:rubrerythrin
MMMFEPKISLLKREKMHYINGVECMERDELCDINKLSIIRYKKSNEKSFKIKQENNSNLSTKAKLIKKIEFEVCDDKLSKNERYICLSMYECTSCHWRFYADIVRFGFGYNSEYKDKPDFCPGCGRKIDD